MSAAGPVQPPSYSSTTNGHVPARPSTANGGSDRAYAHIEDLKADALTGFHPNQSASLLYERAEAAFRQANTNADFGRPDLAFVEYLRAYEIAVETLPKHKDYALFAYDQNGKQKLQVLQRRISSLDDKFKDIKAAIIENNRRSGVARRGQNQQHHNVGNMRGGSDGAAIAIGTPKMKPAPSPKPEKLHSRAISHSTSAVNGRSMSPTMEALANRFSMLRGSVQPDVPPRPDSRSSTASVHSAQLSMPSASDFGGSVDSLHMTTSRPQGPRVMPENGAGPPRPSKLPIDTDLAAAMPKAPSPTYSPARNMQLTGNIPAPRHSARSLAGSNGRKSSLVPSSSASYSAPNESDGYFPATPTNGVAPGQIPRRKSIHVPKETSIDAQKLYDYLDRFSMLLIDFRPREEFDQGHIFTRNIICVDPMIVLQGMSAEQLAEKLVLSPEEEQELFSQRDNFDLVVYYDSSTLSDSYLRRSTSDHDAKLRQLHEALDEFNQDKPLQQAPILLAGGIQAWVDLIGNQALVMSQTQGKAKQGRPIQRRIATREGPMRVPKRRLRDYNPLDAEEERKWRARAKSESVPETAGLVQPIEGDEYEPGDDSEGLKYPDIDEFNARFPEAGTLGQEMFAAASPRPAPQPQAQAQLPQYPTAPSTSVYPPVPARPAPAAPRMSYTGVSDRATSHGLPPRTSSQMVPYIPPKYMATNIRLPRTGLINFGSTCYMNATLQALSATTPLSIMFFDNNFQRHIVKENWKGSKGLLPEIYSNTLRQLWKGDVSCIKPTTLFNFVGRLNSMFKDPGQQQDAQEFFSMIVDVLHEDFNSGWNRTPMRALTEAEEQKRERMPKIVVAKTEWGRFTHRDNSVLTSLFYGQQASRLKCPQCGITSTQYDAWALLQVEIPDRPEARLQDCLRQHFSDELLDEDNQWTCPQCRAPRRARKKLTMTRAPPYLVIGLKRFKTNPRTGDQRKLHTAVRFPLDGLDMEEFMLPQPSPRDAQDIATRYGPDAVKTDVSLTPPYVYDAYAVVRHLGESTRSGHYTAAVKDRARNCWRYFNDTQATDFQPDGLSPAKALDNDNAYLIFWQRRTPNVN